MSGPDRPIWFAGDRDDPVAGAIAAALPAGQTRFLDCPDHLPGPWPGVSARGPRVVVLHRAHLGATDAARVARLRRRLDPTRPIILCVGPHVRYADTERWAGLVDLILPEALAAETIARHVGLVEPSRGPSTGRTVAVVSTQPELRAAWAAILRGGGYEVTETVTPEATPPGLAAVWDVPVLEPTWPARLASRIGTGPVVASIGFLDRTTREIARRSGASACLDAPCDLADLVLAVDRMVGIRRDAAHPGPPAPLSGGKTAPAARRKR